MSYDLVTFRLICRVGQTGSSLFQKDFLMVPVIYILCPSLCWGSGVEGGGRGASLPGSELWAGRFAPKRAVVLAALDKRAPRTGKMRPAKGL